VVAATKFQVFIISLPEVIRVLDNRKFMKNKKTAAERRFSTPTEGRNFSP